MWEWSADLYFLQTQCLIITKHISSSIFKKSLLLIKSASIHAYFSIAEILVDTCIQPPHANLSNENSKLKEITPRL